MSKVLAVGIQGDNVEIRLNETFSMGKKNTKIPQNNLEEMRFILSCPLILLFENSCNFKLNLIAFKM